MRFQVRTDRRDTAGSRDSTVYVLEEAGGSARAEVWPALGFNCYAWQMRHDGLALDLLYADPRFFIDGRPTRSGIPILFPFPNRIDDGRFTWEGQTYQLPLNDSPGKTAIHGFACRLAWRVVDQGGNDEAAWLTGEFHGSVDAPDSRRHWPADYRIRITYRLSVNQLRLEAVVDNPDRVLLPFGLGYHPYFRQPLVPGGDSAACRVQVAAGNYWELREGLPTGTQHPVDAARDLNTPRRVGELNLDDVLTRLPQATEPGTEPLCLRGTLSEAGVTLRQLCSPAFREMVLFTPVHRQAICLEPYTCTTDAINLQQRGLDVGLRILSPGETWSGVVEMRVGR
jgi:aldose 1-epimerase